MRFLRDHPFRRSGEPIDRATVLIVAGLLLAFALSAAAIARHAAAEPSAFTAPPFDMRTARLAGAPAQRV